MAKIYPDRKNREMEYDDKNERNESAERTVCNMIEDTFGEEVVGRLAKNLNTRKSDLILIIRDKGILIIEVKSYSREFLEKYDDNNLLWVKEKYRKDEFEEGIKHPYNQANEYRYAMRKDFEAFLKRENINRKICKIGCMVAMPNLSNSEYEDVGLHYGVVTKLVMTKDWFVTKEIFKENFYKAINQIFLEMKVDEEFNDDYYKAAKGYISKDELDKYKKNNNLTKVVIKSNFEKVEKQTKMINKIAVKKIFDENKKDKIYNYSIMKIICENIEKELNEANELRKNGTKVFLVFLNLSEDSKNFIIEKYKRIVADKYFRIQENSYSSFLFEIYFIDSDLFEMQGKDIVIVDGKFDNIQRKLLENLDKLSSFNFYQYQIEHFEVGKDISIQASAGTGKTFTMVGRISYLIHKEIIEKASYCRIDELIYMMTFTNNSTDEMKERLRSHYINYYKVTKKDIYMEFIEQIDSIKIKTIDAMTKDIVKRFAHLVGLSEGFMLKSGRYEFANILRRQIDEYTKKNTKVIEKFKSKRIYEIEKDIAQIYDFIENRKIEITEGLFASCPDNSIKEFIENIIIDTNKEYMEDCIDRDVVPMSQTGIKLLEIKNKLKNNLAVKDKLFNRYLFIDEFQDTDDKQIELITFFLDYWAMNVFIVGDIKQSIYRFRGAESTAFARLRTNRDKIKELYLQKNYRSSEGIISYINKVFEKVNESKLMLYEEKEKLIAQKSNREVNAVEKIGYTDEELIKSVQDRKKYMKENKINGDIAILVRKNSEKNRIKKIFNGKEHIEFEEEENFFGKDAIIDFYKLVDLLIDFNDKQKLYSVMSSPYFENKISRKEIYELKEMFKFDYVDKIENKDKQIGKYIGLIKNEEFTTSIKNSPALKVLMEIIKIKKPWEQYIPEGINEEEAIKERRSEYREDLFRLFEILIDNNKADYMTLNKIKKYLEISILTKQKINLIDESKKQEKQNKIICITIHASKGLQYNTVILPYTGEEMRSLGYTDLIINNKQIEYLIKGKKMDYGTYEYQFKSNNYDLYKKKDEKLEKQEELRILYVAITRAENKIIWFYNNHEGKMDREENNNIIDSNTKVDCWGTYLGVEK